MKNTVFAMLHQCGEMAYPQFPVDYPLDVHIKVAIFLKL
jgi:hypothetical protein